MTIIDLIKLNRFYAYILRSVTNARFERTRVITLLNADPFKYFTNLSQENYDYLFTGLPSSCRQTFLDRVEVVRFRFWVDFEQSGDRYEDSI